MTLRHRIMPVLLAAFAATSLFGPRPQAEALVMPFLQTDACYEALNRYQSQVQASNRAFEQSANDFLVDTVVDTAIGDASALVRDRATNPPTLARGREMANYKATLEGYERAMRVYQVTLKDLLECLAPGSGCNIVDLARKQNAALRRWIESLASDRTQVALDRVRGAQSLVQNAVSQTGGIMAGSGRDALNCINEYIQQAGLDRADAVDFTDPPSARTPPVDPGSGIGAGMITAVVVVPIAIAGAAVAISKASESSQGGCPPEPNISFNACFLSGGAGRADCQAALARLDAYCRSCNPPQQRGREGRAYECVP